MEKIIWNRGWAEEKMKQTDKLTKKQLELYEVIKAFIEKNGYPPTIRELNEITNIKSTSTTFVKLLQLKKKGYIEYAENKSRTIKLLK